MNITSLLISISLLGSVVSAHTSVAASNTPANAIQTATTVVAGQQYRGGTRVMVPGLEAEFTIPKGWVGIQPVGSGVFLMRSWKRKGHVQMYAIAGDAAHVKKGLTESFELEYDVHLLPLAAPQQHDAWASNEFAVTNTQEPFRAHVMALSRDPGLGLAIVASGPLPELAEFRQLAKQIADTVKGTSKNHR